MNPVSTQSDGAVILYDADNVGKIDVTFFEPEAWRRRGALIGEARGRGTTWIVRHENQELVLRHYRRGGLFGPWLGDRYLWLGLERTRALREWRLLADLHGRGLPVPRPVAARVQRSGLCYRADLVTARLDGTRSLAQTLADTPLSEERWRAVGRCLRRFHDAGVYHADLNAHNVLFGAGDVYLLDFDRGRLRPAGGWCPANLARLRRSLDKLAGADRRFRFDEQGWDALLAGYAEGAASTGQSSARAAR